MVASFSLATVVTLAFAVVTLVFDKVSDFARDFVAQYVRAIANTAVADKEIEAMECESFAVDLSELVSRQRKESVVLGRLGDFVEREEVLVERTAVLVERSQRVLVLLERSEQMYQAAASVLLSYQFIALCLVLGCLLVFHIGTKHGGGRAVLPRAPNPRPLL